MKSLYLLSLFLFYFFGITYSQEIKSDSLFFLKTRQDIKKMASLKEYEEVLVLSKRIIQRRKVKRLLANDYYRLGFYSLSGLIPRGLPR